VILTNKKRRGLIFQNIRKSAAALLDSPAILRAAGGTNSAMSTTGGRIVTAQKQIENKERNRPDAENQHV
jgi:hypothetical protein